MKSISLFILIAIAVTAGSCKKKGCTDSTASNYSQEAKKDDKSCEYNFFIESEAIAEGQLLDDYRCEEKVNGIEASIPLEWHNIPEGTGSLAIIMEHSSNGNGYLLLWNIDPSISSIAHGAADDGPFYMGSNKDGDYISYTSPCSQSGPGTNSYVITIYALSETPPSLPSQSTLAVDLATLKSAIETVTVLGKASITFIA